MKIYEKDLIPGTNYKCATHDGLGRNVYGIGAANEKGFITSIRIKTRNGSSIMHPRWFRVMSKA